MAGTRTMGHNVIVSYFSQDQDDLLTSEKTVWQEVFEVAPNYIVPQLRTLLGCFLFSGDSVEKSVSVLSGGEKSRLALVKLLLDPPNLLLMDEPTAHLDLKYQVSLLGLARDLAHQEKLVVLVGSRRAIAMAVDWVKANATKFHGNPNRIFIWAQSAGNGPTGQWLGWKR